MQWIRRGGVAAIAVAAAALADPAWAGPCDGAGEDRMIVKFAVGSVSVSPQDRAKLKRYATQTVSGQKVCLLGQADAQGSEASNARLALRRAESVRRALIGYGLRPEQVEAHAQEKQFTLFGLLDDEQQNDRRVVVGRTSR